MQPPFFSLILSFHHLFFSTSFHDIRLLSSFIYHPVCVHMAVQPSPIMFFTVISTEIEKKKLCSADNGEAGVGGASGGTGGTGNGGVSASLTPAIWEKTIPYDGETFHLEYMDLDEFLQENGIPVTLEEELQKSLAQEETKGTRPPFTTSDTETVTLTLEPTEQEKEEDGDDEDSVFEVAEVEVSKNKKGTLLGPIVKSPDTVTL